MESTKRYKKILGKVTEFNVLVTEDLICNVIIRIKELEKQENDTTGGLS